MSYKSIEYIKSKYKYINIKRVGVKTYYFVNLPRVTKDSFTTEREAAIAVDIILINRGKEPVNILKRKI